MVDKKESAIIFGIIFMLVLFTSVSIVSAATRHVKATGSDTGNNCLDSGDPCKTIQHGINQAATSDTVTVKTGSYTEDIYINKSIMLNSSTGPTAVFINGTIKVNSSASNLVIGGSDGRGFNFINESNAGIHRGDWLIGFVEGAANNVEISYNVFNTSNATDVEASGIYVAGFNITGLKVYKNTFYLNDTGIGVFIDQNDSFTAFNITDNTFSVGNDDNSSNAFNYTAAIKITSPNITSSDSWISRNTIEDAKTGIIIGNISNSTGIIFGTSTLYINNNTFFKSHVGIDISSTFGPTVNNSNNINISNNNFTRIFDVGIGINLTKYIENTGVHIHPSNFSITGNVFKDIEVLAINNSYRGRTNKRERTIIAERNYWGDSTGPGKGIGGMASGGGLGENLTSFVDYSPFCTLNASCLTINHTQVGGVGDAFDVIQNAIDNASYNDIIEISNSSVWHANVTIGERLTVRGVSGTSTSVYLNGTVTFNAGSNYSVLGGTDGQGIRIGFASAVDELVTLATATDYINISYNIINTTGSPDAGIVMEDSNITGLRIGFNTFWIKGSGIGISNPDNQGVLTSLTIENNTFDNAAGNTANYSVAMALTAVNVSTVTSLITGNTINDGLQGIVIGNLTASQGIRYGSSYLRVDNNTFFRNNVSFDYVSFDARTENTTHDIRLTYNNVTNAHTYGFAFNVSLFTSNLVGRANLTQFVVQRNIFDGNIGLAINNSIGSNLTAELNFWGNTTNGAPGNEGGNGDNISVAKWVDYDPWFLYFNLTDLSNKSTASSSTSTATASSGGGGGSATWTNTFFASDDDLMGEDGYNKVLGKKQRVKFSVASENHFVGVIGITESTVTVEISSDPQEATLSVGDLRKFEVNGDNNYDVSVKLNSITGSKADLTIKAIDEVITPQAIEQEEEKQVAAEEIRDFDTETQQRNLIIWIVVIIVVVLVLLGIGFGVKKKRSN